MMKNLFMKNLVTWFVVLLMLVSPISVFAQNSNEESTNKKNVEISFRLGDNILNINGTPIEVVRPFAEGGTTLVPVRVITEAFGAEVIWDGEAQKVTILYNDMTILLTLGSTDAYINGQKQTLLLAPLAIEGATMVPLRFISEAFGSDVSIDGTNKITVTLSDTKIDDISSALKRSNMPYVGDSFYKWSMQMPKNFIIESLSHDRRELTFVSDDNNVTVEIYIFENEGQETLDTVEVKETKNIGNGALVKQERSTTNMGVAYVCTQIKYEDYFQDAKVYLNGDNIFVVVTYLENDLSKTERQKYLDVTNTFDFFLDKEQTQDLSNVENGFRLFDNKEFQVAFKIPSAWHEESSAMNRFEFSAKRKENIYQTEHVSLIVTSIVPGMSLSDWLQTDYKYNKESLNPTLNRFSEVEPCIIAGQSGLFYTRTYTKNNVVMVSRDIFFYYEGYAYNLAIETTKANAPLMDAIQNSLKVSKINAEEVGKLSLKDYTKGNVFNTLENKDAKYKISVPVTWSNQNNIYSDPYSGTILSIQVIDASALRSPELVAQYYKNEVLRNLTFVSDANSGKIPNEKLQLVFKDDLSSNTTMVKMNFFIKGDVAYMAITTIPEFTFTDSIQEKVYKILNSIESTK